MKRLSFIAALLGFGVAGQTINKKRCDGPAIQLPNGDIFCEGNLGSEPGEPGPPGLDYNRIGDDVERYVNAIPETAWVAIADLFNLPIRISGKYGIPHDSARRIVHSRLRQRYFRDGEWTSIRTIEPDEKIPEWGFIDPRRAL